MMMGMIYMRVTYINVRISELACFILRINNNGRFINTNISLDLYVNTS